ncbi:hypothetical protein CLV86_1419 [Lacinutrix venerupis]|uniref:EamA/RhaT family transporter n=1 Tax=Lacinutrix venerupis TaxID=1486034 RepID=UPI000EB45C1B|nr:EamA/RhaT family transporter [Lacinutrix venerupis]RLJ64303.1 hypothetical protein CLV86_1419 [Lacinutrix venerupis]
MIYLIISILASTLVFVLFKLLSKYKINTLQTIIVNYFVAFTIGITSATETITLTSIINKQWFYGAVFLGFLFITMFNVVALTAQKNGLSVASVASKMSVVIPIAFGIYAYNENLSPQKLLGISLALIAVYLTSIKVKTSTVKLKNVWLPVILFIGSGIIDTTLKYIETTYVSAIETHLFSAIIFAIAGLIGITILSAKAIKGALKIDFRSIYSGLILGIINYYSIYMLLKALQIDQFESSIIFTLNNVAIVMISTLVGLSFFKEKLSLKNWFGIALAIVSIILVTLA